MKTEMNAIMRISDQQDLSEDSKITFAVNEGMRNIETFIMEYYPEAERKSYPGLQACFEAVANEDADCVLVSNYRVPSEEDTLKKSRLYSVPTGETLPFSFAMKNTDLELYTLMNRTVLSTKGEEMGASLASYISLDQRTTFILFMDVSDSSGH